MECIELDDGQMRIIRLFSRAYADKENAEKRYEAYREQVLAMFCKCDSVSYKGKILCQRIEVERTFFDKNQLKKDNPSIYHKYETKKSITVVNLTKYGKLAKTEYGASKIMPKEDNVLQYPAFVRYGGGKLKKYKPYDKSKFDKYRKSRIESI